MTPNHQDSSSMFVAVPTEGEREAPGLHTDHSDEAMRRLRHPFETDEPQHTPEPQTGTAAAS